MTDSASMACPQLRAARASPLAEPDLLNTHRNHQRSDDIVKRGHKSAESLVSGGDYQGSGFLSKRSLPWVRL